MRQRTRFVFTNKEGTAIYKAGRGDPDPELAQLLSDSEPSTLGEDPAAGQTPCSASSSAGAAH